MCRAARRRLIQIFAVPIRISATSRATKVRAILTITALVASFNKRQGDWAAVRLSYTLSKSIDNSGNFFFSSPQDNSNLRGERGLSDNDQRHRLTISGTFNTPNTIENKFARKAFGGFQTSYIYTYASKLPFNVLAGSDLNGDSNNNDRPFDLGRNYGKRL